MASRDGNVPATRPKPGWQPCISAVGRHAGFVRMCISVARRHSPRVACTFPSQGATPKAGGRCALPQSTLPACTQPRQGEGNHLYGRHLRAAAAQGGLVGVREDVVKVRKQLRALPR